MVGTMEGGSAACGEQLEMIRPNRSPTFIKPVSAVLAEFLKNCKLFFFFLQTMRAQSVVSCTKKDSSKGIES